MRAAYPGVQVVPIGAKPAAGRPLVAIADVVRDLLAQPGDLFALANADISILADRAAIARICEAAQHGLVACRRTETDDLAKGRGPVYRAGFDLFVCHRRTLEAIPLDGLAFGMPWWDYALPVLALLRDVPIFRADPAYLRHYTHNTAWSAELWRDGLIAYARLLEQACGPSPRGEALFIGELAASLRRFAEPRGIVPLHGDGQIYSLGTLFSLANVSLIDRVAITL